MCRCINAGPFMDATDNLSFIYLMTDLLIRFLALLGIWVCVVKTKDGKSYRIKTPFVG